MNYCEMHVFFLMCYVSASNEAPLTC